MEPCGRELWSTLPAVVFVALLILVSLPIPSPRVVSKIVTYIRAPFLPTLTLAEAEQLEHQFESEQSLEDPRQPLVDSQVHKAPWWRTALFASLTLVELLAWLALGIINVVYVARHASHREPWTVIFWMPFLTSITWVYALTRVLHQPPFTPPFDLLILFTLHLIGGVLTLGGQLYTSQAWGTSLPPKGVLVAEGVHLGIVVVLLALVVSLPLNVPSSHVDREKIGTTLSPEDYTTLAGWITFSWVRPLIVIGTSKMLNDEDVWDISPTLKTKPTFFSYQQITGSSILWKLLRVNSMDLIIDFLFTEVSVVLEFGGPYFLKQILSGLEHPELGSRSELYLYAVLAFTAAMLKAQADLQHLWYGRRASSRIGTQLSAAIYDKALRVTDQSGVVSASGPESSVERDGKVPGDGKKAMDGKQKDGHDGRQKDQKEPDKKGSSDVGKIVNLMGIDAQKLQDQVVGMPHIYTAPLQLVLSCVYLYSLLGFSAFAGFISLLLAVPLSQWLAGVTMRITKGLLTAKDNRMKLVNEMFGAIKFIKFFAWETRWIKRVMDSRDVEITWLRKARNVNVGYSLVWSLVPSLVSVVSFLVFVSTGHELSVSVAFTAIRLFEMLRMPLNALPYALVTLAQTKVSLDRLTEFFAEGEVPDDVSSFTRPASSEMQELRIDHGTFRWTGTKLTPGDAKADDSPKPRDADPSTASQGELASSEDDSAATASTSTRTAVEREREGEQTFQLRDVSLRLTPGVLTVVTGPTASGKTALLMALLGEMETVSGSASIPKNPSIIDEHGLRNTIAYAAQTPWLQQQSIKDNIVFGYPFDQKRYDEVVEACALGPDFAQLEDGDRTEIGSKGVSLSGGQKARVALARAVYAPTQYLILDDIFSAVDSHTARFLFECLLQGSLVAHRTVLLVTHHVELVLPGTHYLIQLKEGRVDHQGTVAELKQQGILDYIAHDPSLHPRHKDATEGAASERADKAPATQSDSTGADGQPKQARKLVEDEVRAEGRVKWGIYNTYLKASSYWTWVCVLLGIVAAEVFDVGTRVWVGIWGTAYNEPTTALGLSGLSASSAANGHFMFLSDQWPIIHQPVFRNLTVVQERLDNGWPDAHAHPLFYVGVYCGIGVAAALVAICTQWVLFTGGLRGGRILFQSLLISLSAATFRFFDTTPTGRILNRFGKDFDTLDRMLPFMLHHTTTSLAAFLAAVVTVTVVVPWFLPVGAVLAYCYIRLSIGYLATGRDLRRLESTSRSPILAGFSDLVEGIVTVRAFSAEKQFLEGHYKRVDTTNRFWYFTWMLNRYLLLHFDALGAISVFAATLFVLGSEVPVGFAGLSIVSAMAFSMSVYWTCRGYTELELCLNSVERVVEFLDVPKEPPTVIESNRVPAYWPSSSDSDSLLVVENLEVKYAPELPSVLHDISFNLKSKERVGLLGRTGCGKSTLAMSLLRFVDPTGGRIIIDGIDIATIGTHDLRSRVTFIPQDATLFAGSLRENLDPFNEHTDAECLDALVRVHLISEASSASQKSSRAPSRASSVHGEHEESATSSSLGSETATQTDMDSKITITLDTKVSAGGQNFSNGQRQLLAMARALLRQSAVVILDEATSSIDKAADVKIQATIREEFNRSLLLTIAHRLETIIDFDRLIVLDKGRIVEFDTPWNLIQKEGGIFREMCIHSGTYKELEASAKMQAQK